MISKPLTSRPWYDVIWRRLTPTLLALASSTSAPTLASAGLFDARMFQLSNGMQVVLIPDHRAPVVTHMLWYRVGSADEPPGKSGLAHFFEHLMFKGTPNHPGDAYARLIDRAGGGLNAFTSYDYTAYYATVGTESLELVMTLEADRMMNLTLSEEKVRVEREVIVEERRLRIDTDPEALLHEQVMATLFLNHRYGMPVIGWLHEIRSWTLDDALAFYRRWYHPSNAILVVAGEEKYHAAHHGVVSHIDAGGYDGTRATMALAASRATSVLAYHGGGGGMAPPRTADRRAALVVALRALRLRPRARPIASCHTPRRLDGSGQGGHACGGQHCVREDRGEVRGGATEPVFRGSALPLLFPRP